MLVYAVLLFILVACACYEMNEASYQSYGFDMRMPSSYRKYHYILLPVAFLLVIGIFRETTMGYDTLSYYTDYWARVDDYSWKELCTNFSIDNGFFIILKTIALFTDDWWLARAILYVITFLLYFNIVQENSPYPAVSLIIILGLTLLGLMFSILRQALAGAISLYAYKQIKKSSFIKAILIILVAATIHKSALLSVYLLAVYVVQRKKISTVLLVVLSVLAYLTFMIGIPLITRLYADSRYVDIAAHNGGYGMLAFMIVVIMIITRLIQLSGTKKDIESGYLFNISCGALFIQIGALMWDLLNRTTVYFSFYWSILIPILLYKVPAKKRCMYFAMIVLLFGFMFIYQISDAEKYVFHQFV